MLVFFGCSKEEAQNKEKQESVFQPSKKDLQIEVPLTDGKVSIVDAVIAYDQVIDLLAQHYSKVSGTDNHLVLAIHLRVFNN